jgi:hypothetical protein
MIYKIEWSEWKDDLKEMSQEDDKVLSINPQSHPGGMAMNTPLGMLPVPMTNIKFVSDNITMYLMQTNFDLTKNLIKIISLVRGVVSVEPITRYMARIGIPASNLFDDESVQDEIRTSLIYFFETKDRVTLSCFDQDIIDKVMEFRGKLNEKQEFWTMLVLPNGSIDVASTNIHNQQYKDKCKLLIETHKQVGGKILASHKMES